MVCIQIRNVLWVGQREQNTPMKVNQHLSTDFRVKLFENYLLYSEELPNFRLDHDGLKKHNWLLSLSSEYP